MSELAITKRGGGDCPPLEFVGATLLNSSDYVREYDCSDAKLTYFYEITITNSWVTRSIGYVRQGMLVPVGNSSLSETLTDGVLRIQKLVSNTWAVSCYAIEPVD